MSRSGYDPAPQRRTNSGLARVAQIPDDEDGADANGNDEPCENQCHAEQDPLDPIHPPLENGHNLHLWSHSQDERSGGRLAVSLITEGCDGFALGAGPSVTSTPSFSKPNLLPRYWKSYLGHNHPNVPAVSRA